jgi:hyperosmotically inducible periplasmic protein
MMKNKLVSFATIAGVTVALAAPAVAQTTGTTEQQTDRTAAERADESERGVGQRMEDAWIVTKVKTQFVGEDALEDSDIDVDVKKGVVTLKGTVASAAGRERAKEIARETEGVVRVNDKLKIGMAKNDRNRDDRTAARDDDRAVATTGVDSDDHREHGTAVGTEMSGTREDQRTTAREGYDEAREVGREAREAAREGRDEAREEGREARGEARETSREARDETREAGRDTREAVGTAGSTVNDGWITTKVKTSFVGEDVLDNSNIDVDTKNGVVTLKGNVASSGAKNRAEQIAKDVDGVKRVKNQLKVKAQNEQTDNR